MSQFIIHSSMGGDVLLESENSLEHRSFKSGYERGIEQAHKERSQYNKEHPNYNLVQGAKDKELEKRQKEYDKKRLSMKADISNAASRAIRDVTRQIDRISSSSVMNATDAIVKIVINGDTQFKDVETVADFDIFK